jgi:hypothetical protein
MVRAPTTPQPETGASRGAAVTHSAGRWSAGVGPAPAPLPRAARRGVAPGGHSFSSGLGTATCGSGSSSSSRGTWPAGVAERGAAAVRDGQGRLVRQVPQPAAGDAHAHAPGQQVVPGRLPRPRRVQQVRRGGKRAAPAPPRCCWPLRRWLAALKGCVWHAAQATLALLVSGRRAPQLPPPPPSLSPSCWPAFCGSRSRMYPPQLAGLGDSPGPCRLAPTCPPAAPARRHLGECTCSAGYTAPNCRVPAPRECTHMRHDRRDKDWKLPTWTWTRCAGGWWGRGGLQVHGEHRDMIRATRQGAGAEERGGGAVHERGA